MLNLGKFHNIVRLVAFSPFSSSQVALENANAVSEGELATKYFGREKPRYGFCYRYPLKAHRATAEQPKKVVSAVEDIGFIACGTVVINS